MGEDFTRIFYFVFFERGRISWGADERKIFCFQGRKGAENFFKKNKKIKFLGGNAPTNSNRKEKKNEV